MASQILSPSIKYSYQNYLSLSHRLCNICNDYRDDRVGTRKYQNGFTIDNFLLCIISLATMTDFVNESGAEWVTITL